MSSFRDIQFETEQKKSKLEKSKTVNVNYIYSNPFQIYKQYNTERNQSKNKINASKDTYRITDSGKLKPMVSNNQSLPVEEDVDSHQPTRIEQQDMEFNNKKMIENNQPHKIEVNNASPLPESLSGNSRIIKNQSKRF
jgi:hypothetical protein